MLVVNKLTEPGGIRRVDLLPDVVRVETNSGVDRLYELASVVGEDELVAQNARIIASDVRADQE